MIKNLQIFAGLILSLGVISCSRPATLGPSATAEEVIQKSNAAIEAINFLDYEATYRVKYFTDDDTTLLQGRCIIEKQKTDTIFGFQVLIRQKDKEHLYTGDSLYVVDHQTNEVIVDDPKKNGPYFITGNIVNGLLFRELIQGTSLQKLRENAATLSLQNYSPQYWLIEIFYPAKENEKSKGHTKKLWISKKTQLPERMEFVATYDNLTQYNEVILTSLRTTPTDKNHNWFAFKYPDGYAVEYFEEPTEEDFKTLENGTVAPDAELTDFSGQKIRLSSFKGNVVVLDFWYMSCPPCLEALPHLENLYQTFKSKGVVVLGINSTDSFTRKEKLPSFLSERNITYPTYFADRTVDSSFNVRVYPTLYILDKEGKVVYAKLGFGEKSVETLKQEILKVTEKN